MPVPSLWAGVGPSWALDVGESVVFLTFLFVTWCGERPGGRRGSGLVGEAEVLPAGFLEVGTLPCGARGQPVQSPHAGA